MRRTQLRRTTELERKTPIPRIGRLQVIQGTGAPVVALKPRPRRETGFSAKVKMDVRKRAGNGEAAAASCESCGRWLGVYGGQIQHREARGIGGTSLPITNSVINGVLLCGDPLDKSTCHGKAEDRDPEMNATGMWLRNGEGPAETPIMLHSVHGSGITVWLLADGSYGYEEPGGGDAA